MRPHTARLIDTIRAGRKSRHALTQHEANALAALKRGDPDAQLVLDVIKRAVPSDPYFWFLGFCPNADIGNRLDTAWRTHGICTCTIDRFDDSRGQQRQIEDFLNIRIGDRLILKKDKRRGHTMTLHGHGRVTALAEEGATQPCYIERSLIVDWAAQATEIEVPFMGCTATVNWRDADRVEREMSADFFAWLGEDLRRPHAVPSSSQLKWERTSVQQTFSDYTEAMRARDHHALAPRAKKTAVAIAQEKHAQRQAPTRPPTP